MNALFAAAKFDEAKAEIERIIKDCEACSEKTRALLHRDLAVVMITGFSDGARARKEMHSALQLDPALELDPLVTTPEVQAIFDAQKNESKKIDEPKVVLDEEPDEDNATEPSKEVVPREQEQGEEASAPSSPAPSVRAASPRIWLQLGVMQDSMIVSGSDVCSEHAQVTGGFTCTRASGSQYHGTPASSGGVSGLAFAATRVAFGSMFRVTDDLSAFARVAFAFAGQGPRPDGGSEYLPIEIEVGGAYWLSERALATTTVGSFVELSGGMAEIDGRTSAFVREDRTVPPPVSQLDNPDSQRLRVYQKSGRGFAAAGAGAFLPFAKAFGLLGDARVMVLFPTSGIALSFSVSAAFGL